MIRGRQLARPVLTATALAVLSLALAAGQQPAPTPMPAGPLARSLFASLGNLQTSLAAVNPERWRAKPAVRDQFQTDRAAINRNLVEALPSLALKVEGAPQDLGQAFRLYRDVDAVYSVALRVADLTARYADANQSQAVSAALEQVHRNLDALADFIQVTGSAQSAELLQLRAQHDAPPPAPPKAVVIDNANTPPPSRPHATRRSRKTKKAAPKPKPSPTPPPTPHP